MPGPLPTAPVAASSSATTSERYMRAFAASLAACSVQVGVLDGFGVVQLPLLSCCTTSSRSFLTTQTDCRRWRVSARLNAHSCRLKHTVSA